jgi:hypothetical protein
MYEVNGLPSIVTSTRLRRFVDLTRRRVAAPSGKASTAATSRTTARA